jgi:hypothetical protein
MDNDPKFYGHQLLGLTKFFTHEMSSDCGEQFDQGNLTGMTA